MEFDRLVVGFLVDEVVGGFFISVPPGHIACVFDRGRGVLPKVWGPGLHLKIPFWQVAKMFNAQILEYAIRRGFDPNFNREDLGDEPIVTTTNDGKNISIEGSVLFRIDKHNAPELWENIGDNFVSKMVRPISRSRISAVFSQLSIQQITSNRTAIEQAVKEELSRQFADKGINCEGFLLSEVKVLNPKGRDEVLVQENTNIHSSPSTSSFMSEGSDMLRRME
jgi:regulator of protease activity HflC (stomatin/prohibitin superfamily)